LKILPALSEAMQKGPVAHPLGGFLSDQLKSILHEIYTSIDKMASKKPDFKRA
jgi:hypothetical protein